MDLDELPDGAGRQHDGGFVAREREAIDWHSTTRRPLSGPRGAARSLGVPASTLESRTND